MKLALLFSFFFTLTFAPGCAVPDHPEDITVAPTSVTGAIPAKPVRPPSWCADGGGCPLGLACGDDGICGTLCGVNFVCPIGWYCFAFGPGHVNHDCLPAGSCIYADGGC